jgi:hypothetical protein
MKKYQTGNGRSSKLSVDDNLRKGCGIFIDILLVEVKRTSF